MNVKQILQSGFGVMIAFGVWLIVRGGVEGPATAIVCYGAIGIGVLGSVLAALIPSGGSKQRTPRRQKVSRDPETIKATCRNCGKKYQFGPERAGQKLPCKSCGETFRVPGGRKAAARRPSDWEANARSGAIVLMVLGIGSFLLPMLGLQLRMFARLGDAAQVGGAIASFFGAGLFAYTARHNLALGGGVGGGVIAVTLILLIVHLTSTADDQPKPQPDREIASREREDRSRANPGPIAPMDPIAPFHPADPIDRQVAVTNPPGNSNPPRPQLSSPKTNPPAIQRPRGVQRADTVPGEKTPLAGGIGGGEFALGPENAGPVIGVRYDLGQWGGGYAIRTFEPIGRGEQVSADENTVLARPGYALAGMHVLADKHVRGVRLIFASEAGGRLDLSDSYESDWLGVPAENPSMTLQPDGRYVVGIHGRKGLIMDAVGLIMKSH